jgi:phosphoribosylamine---glycine ligase
MRVLLIGSGGREHALAWKLAQSPLLTQLFIAPGNPGTAQNGDNVVLDVKDHAAIISFCRVQAVNLVIVGPEAPLVAGLADDLVAAGIRVFGPSKAAAQLEGSKDFTKKLCDDVGIPTARYATFTSQQAAEAYLKAQGAPIVIKYDGLMAGKGVTVAMSEAEALAAITALYAGEPSAKLVIEEMMVGEEASFFCLVDGETVLPIGSAQDHKRAYDGDKGPNTGGMGAYSPAPIMDAAMEQRTLNEIVRPTARAMVARGTPYRGVLFAGLMITAEGPKLIEYNCRFGDPECQVLMLRLKDDLLTLLDGVARGELKHLSARLYNHAALGVVMATRGYPGDYINGSVIGGLDAAQAGEGITLFHAGTKMVEGQLQAHGGRVLTLCATGKDVAEAQSRAYVAAAKVDWPEGFYRRDIGARGIAHQTKTEE